MIALLLLLQSAAPAVASPQPERWSILVPTPTEPCVPARQPGDPDDIIICANAQPSPRLPDPDSVPSSGPMKSNPYLTGSGALAAMDTPCPISRNCVVGFGPPIVPLVKGAVDIAKRAFAKKADKTGRVAIPLDEPAPTGTLLP
ncbi:hypothetical protein [Sphingomonas bacterium]|uniref:hypothetical protein n=1 Tax=Sphingomonas bacterium TaxID=1895847 RepID=UPI00261C49CE|nr:hypothetical protein [Sphingomonas bacterium]MDB5679651.1 hypothetical protein [Sphingomonas bacterium]